MAKSTTNTKLSVEQRLTKLEAEMAQLHDKGKTKMSEFLESVVGVFENDPDFGEVVKYGTEWRASFRPKARKTAAKKRGKNARARH